MSSVKQIVRSGFSMPRELAEETGRSIISPHPLVSTCGFSCCENVQCVLAETNYKLYHCHPHNPTQIAAERSQADLIWMLVRLRDLANPLSWCIQ